MLEGKYCIEPAETGAWTETKERDGMQIANHAAHMKRISGELAALLLQQDCNHMRTVFGQLVRVFGQVKMQAMVLDRLFGNSQHGKRIAPLGVQALVPERTMGKFDYGMTGERPCGKIPVSKGHSLYVAMLGVCQLCTAG
jgi:hypothetical protein